ncbi:hypothetical protein HBH53_000180 [Parastagonospora nodorum]|nr:hypothetical protein HBH53_000180 [Parastagonospora nodorum]
MPDGIGPQRRRQPAQRSNRPCDLCRRRKTRCIIDNGQVSCSLCRQRNNECTFKEEPPRRMVAGLQEELSSAPSVQASPSPHDVLNSQQFIVDNGIIAANSNPTHEDQHMYVGHIEGNPASQRPTWSEDALGLNRSKFAELYGLGSDMEPILMRHRPYDPINNEYSLPTHAIRLVSPQDQGMNYPVTFHMVSDQKSVDFLSNYNRVDDIETCIKPHGEKLLRLFWRMVHPIYPILYREGFMNRYEGSYRQIDAPLLGAVYLMAINWWHYDPQLSNQAIVDVNKLRRMTLDAIQSSYHQPRLSSIEAMLLFLQCKPEDPLNPDHSFAWGLTGQALAVGEALGLHLDATRWLIPAWEQSLRKRLSWGLYMQDVWTALAHGRPLHIHEDDWAVEDLAGHDFVEDDWTVERNFFICMTSLTRILYDILKQLYSVKNSTLQDTIQLYTKAQPMLAALEVWRDTLPPHLDMASIPSRQLCANGNIHLAFYAAKISILRRLVRSTALAPLCIDVDVLSAIRQLAHATTQQAIELVASLRLEHLEAFWFFATPYFLSVIGSFCTLLLVTSLTSAERDHWRERLRSYLWVLRVGSKSNEPMRYAVNRLEGAILRGLEHALAVPIDAPSPTLPETLSSNFEADMNGFGFSTSEINGVDISTMELDAFDFLSNTAL